jgi:acyl-CoA synthetase (AMP-forming)/AMP-acid ligase II
MPPSASVGQRPVVFTSLRHLLEHQSKRIPEAPAILALGRAPLTYGRLYQHIDKMARTLRAAGIGRHDRVAVVLPNGPEMAVAILGVATSATCAPMNPTYGMEELIKYFADLRPCALITQAGMDTPARGVALGRSIPVIELSTAFGDEAGLFELTGKLGRAQPHEKVNASDIALLIPTSGTTSRSKIVPQTHAKVCASAQATSAALALRETDRCLNILPLFHGHGLIATVMASLAAGASVVCSPGFDLKNFFAWLAAFQPTWYSAVPTMHQAILGQARHNRDRLWKSGLRFVRSSSASLSPRTFAELEQTFESPVIEWYGMTEVAAAPITCNPLPPRLRKSGSVGVPVALDAAIMDEVGNLLPGGQTGQVVVRGATVMASYDGDPVATNAAFAADWLKTGDLGFFDDDGYLFLTGRLREMINRGGEKIAPREVDEVLLEHPSVAEAVTFAVPHATLGEDVASAIVLRPDIVTTPKEIRQFAIGRIAGFKVPRQVFIVNQIPKSPTGKVQRIGLEARLGLAAGAGLPRAFVAPRTHFEKLLAKHWAEILQIDQIGIYDDFFECGGDSLLATHVLCHVYELTKTELDISRFFEAPTVAELAYHLEQVIETGQTPQSNCAIVHVPRENGIAPASFAQEQLCKLQQALPDIPFFNVLYALRISSRCNASVLERSINEVVRRHEILRTTFAVINDNRYVQVIAPQLVVPLAFDDLRTQLRAKKDTAVHKRVREEVLYSFDLAKGPLIRPRLLRLGEREFLLLISMHQAICDGWSLGVLIEELVAIYDALSDRVEAPLKTLPIQYADFAHWQRRWESHAEIVAQLAYWREQLRDPLPAIQLAGAAPTRTIDNLRTARRAWALPVRLAKAAKNFAHQEGGTLFMVLVAALQILLHRYLSLDDVRVATNVANRNRPGTAELIGPLINTVILRTDLAGDPSPREVLRRVRETVLAAFAHQDIPIEVIAQILERERSLKPTALANFMILLHNSALRPRTRAGRKLAIEEANPGVMLPLVTIAGCDIIWMLNDGTRGLRGTCVYKQDLFSPKVIDRMLQDFQQVLQSMVKQPERSISAIRVSLNEQKLFSSRSNRQQNLKGERSHGEPGRSIY